VPTLPTFWVVVKEKNSVSYGTKHCGGILKSMGFIWRKHQSEREVQFVKREIVVWR
jgi:hypothetical protein